MDKIYIIRSNDNIIYATKNIYHLRDYVDYTIDSHIDEQVKSSETATDKEFLEFNKEQMHKQFQKAFDAYINKSSHVVFLESIRQILSPFGENITAEEIDSTKIIATVSKLMAANICDELIGSPTNSFTGDEEYNKAIMKNLDDLSYNFAERIDTVPFLREDVEEMLENYKREDKL
jgi:predicted nucleotidyltransferase